MNLSGGGRERRSSVCGWSGNIAGWFSICLRQPVRTFVLFFIVLFAVSLFTAGCDDDIPFDTGEDSEASRQDSLSSALKVVEFSTDPSGIRSKLSFKVVRDICPYSLSDASKVSVSVVTSNVRHKPFPAKFQPRLDSIVNVGAREVAAMDINLYALVDLTLPQEDVDRERKAVESMRKLFDNGNFFLRFILGDGTLSERMPVSDYVISNYFVSKELTRKYIYRNLLDEISFLRDRSVEGARKILVVMTDGKVYSDDMTPFDPDYYMVKKRLDEQVDSLTADDIIFYTGFSGGGNAGHQSADDIYLRRICEKTSGLYMDEFSWNLIENEVVKDFSLGYADYRLFVTNPDQRVYNGMPFNIDITFVCEGDTVAVFNSVYDIGSLYDPIVVGGVSRSVVIVRGIFLALVLLYLSHLVFQFFIPYVKYRRFKKKYIRTYTGPSMSVEGKEVATSCYFCKAPFAEGDRIVAKCSHTMHLSCWEENDYHCPEWGRNCPEGSHYYNSRHRMDPRNASFRYGWIVLGIVCGLVIFLAANIMPNTFFLSILNYLSSRLLSVYGIETNIRMIHLLPSIGLYCGGIAAFMINWFINRNKRPSKRLLTAFVRGVICATLCFAVFLYFSILTQTVYSIVIRLLVEVIPWAVAAVAIITVSTAKSGIQFKYKWIAWSALLGVICNLIWYAITTRSFYDYRAELVIFYIMFSVGIMMILAGRTQRSERYFLRVTGMIKEMDIALYKWFQNGAVGQVTIGRSSDCSIVVTWDIKSDVAPVHAIIYSKGGSLYLEPVEAGVTSGARPLKVKKPVRLYKGFSFRIGTTDFTYVERDILSPVHIPFHARLSALFD